MAEPLVVSASLRPWLKSGLSFLLLDSEERAAELRPEKRTEKQPEKRTENRQTARASTPPSAALTPEASAARSQGQTPPSSSPASSSNPEKKGGQPPSGNAPGEGKAPGADGVGDMLRAPVSDGSILPLEAWPAAWQALKNRRPLPPRPLVFWTYAGLGDDLMGTPDATRQQIIVRMLTALHHPGGTHVFWPYALPDDQPSNVFHDEPDKPASPSLFWSGAALLRPRAVLLFGSEARDALNMPKSLVPFCQERIAGRLVIQLPQPTSLVGPDGNDDAFRRALAFLSRLLNFCAAR